jgi:hypothetical protein
MVSTEIATINIAPAAAPTPEEVGLKWPWNEIIRAALRADDAAKRSIAAGARRDVDARMQADMERLDALGDAEKVKDEVADLVMAGLRFAAERQPAGLALFLARLPVPRGVSDRLDQHEDAVLDLEYAQRQAVPV